MKLLPKDKRARIIFFAVATGTVGLVLGLLYRRA